MGQKNKDLKRFWTYENFDYLWRLSEINGARRFLNLSSNNDYKKTKEYVLLCPYKDWSARIVSKSGSYQGIIDLNSFVELLNETEMTGFFEYNYPFVLRETVPVEFEKFVGFHEIEEAYHLDIAMGCIGDVSYRLDFENEKEKDNYLDEEYNYAKKYAHGRACLAEISAIFNRGKGFSRRFAKWILKTNGDDDSTTFFNQIKPGFLKAEGRPLKDPLIILIEFFIELLDYSNVDLAKERCIENWSWIKNYI